MSIILSIELKAALVRGRGLSILSWSVHTVTMSFLACGLWVSFGALCPARYFAVVSSFKTHHFKVLCFPT